MSRRLTVEIADLSPQIAPDIEAKVRAVAAASSVAFQAGTNWSPAAIQALRDIFPKGWIYRGGSHLAQHASPPSAPRRARLGIAAPGGEAGYCILRMVECRDDKHRADAAARNTAGVAP